MCKGNRRIFNVYYMYEKCVCNMNMLDNIETITNTDSDILEGAFTFPAYVIY